MSSRKQKNKLKRHKKRSENKPFYKLARLHAKRSRGLVPRAVVCAPSLHTRTHERSALELGTGPLTGAKETR